MWNMWHESSFDSGPGQGCCRDLAQIDSSRLGKADLSQVESSRCNRLEVDLSDSSRVPSRLSIFARESDWGQNKFCDIGDRDLLTFRLKLHREMVMGGAERHSGICTRHSARGDDAAHPGQALARPRKPYEVWAYSMVVFVRREQACGGRKWREEEQGVVTRWWGDKKEWLTTLTASINA
ncbi:hypothetical protein K438DRAFT_1771160 [Mycena galopus ATCC 62051]|nr:hypothetical protein K438DRAFT_1771160 [Mycena galopus ATCC 62051]